MKLKEKKREQTKYMLTMRFSTVQQSNAGEMRKIFLNRELTRRMRLIIHHRFEEMKTYEIKPNRAKYNEIVK